MTRQQIFKVINIDCKNIIFDQKSSAFFLTINWLLWLWWLAKQVDQLVHSHQLCEIPSNLNCSFPIGRWSNDSWPSFHKNWKKSIFVKIMRKRHLSTSSLIRPFKKRNWKTYRVAPSHVTASPHKPFKSVAHQPMKAAYPSVTSNYIIIWLWPTNGQKTRIVWVALHRFDKFLS